MARHAFPVIKDLVVDRGSFDRIIQAGGYISANTGSAPDAHATPVPKPNADRSFKAAECIQLRRLRGGLPNASAMLFLGAKITHLGELPQGQPERMARVVTMVTSTTTRASAGAPTSESAPRHAQGHPAGRHLQLNIDLRTALRGNR